MFRKISKLLSILLCLAVLFGTVAGCSPKKSGGSGESKPAESESNGSDEETASKPSDPIEPEIPAYTLSYRGGDGAGGNPPTAVKARAGETVTVSANTFTKSGYQFSVWSDGEKTYAPGDRLTMPARNVTLTAQWVLDTREQVTISFHTMGGSALDAITVGKGETLDRIHLPVAYKDGHVFSEWYLDEALTKPFYESLETLNASITLYARYFDLAERATTYLGTGESSLTSQSPHTVIQIDSFGVKLTQENFTDYITITNNYTIKEKPAITLSQSGDLYMLQADPAWPTGGNFYIEAKEPVKIIIEQDDGEGNMVELALSKLFFTVHVGENKVHTVEKASIIPVQHKDYYAMTEDKLYLLSEFGMEQEISKGRVLKVFDENGAYEYVKVGSTGTENFDGVTAFVVRTVAPSLNDIYNDFELSYTEENISSADYLDTIDEEDVINTMTQSEGFRQFQNMTTAMVADYAIEQGFAAVGGIELLDGSTIMNEKGARGGHYNPIAVIDLSRSEFKIENGTITGTWFVIMRGVNQYGKVQVSFGTHSDMWVSADGDCSLDMDVQVDWPWEEDFLDVDVDLNIWFDVYLGHQQSIEFTFDIIYYNDGVEYDVREALENGNATRYPDNFAEKYKALISMDNRELPLFSIDLFVFQISVLKIVDIKVPVGVELAMSVNGSFSVVATSQTRKYYGLKGDITRGFESYSGETYCRTSTTIYYSGTFGIRAGVFVAVDISFLGLGKLGSVGVEVGFGVYYDFYGHGYTSTWYQKESADSRLEINATETGNTTEIGGAFSEIGLYFKISIYAKSEIFKVRVDVEHVWKIPLVRSGDQYLLLDFSEGAKNYAREGIVFGDDGINLLDLELHHFEQLDLSTGNVVTCMASDLPEDVPATLLNLIRYGDFNMQAGSMLSIDWDTGLLTVQDRYKKLGARVDTQLTLIGYLAVARKVEGANRIILTIPVTYIPDSMGYEADKLNETVNVKFMIDDIVYREIDIPYGSTIMGVAYGSALAELSSMRGADDAFYAAHPQYANVSWHRNDWWKPILEDTVIRANYHERLISITYQSIWGVSQDGEPLWSSGQIAVHRNDDLYDVLPELADPSEHIRIRDENPWNVENRKLDFADEGIIVTAVYDYQPVTLTIQVDAYETDFVSVPAETFTYTLAAGDLIREYIDNHLSLFFRSYGTSNWTEYGVWWTAYVKEGEIYGNAKIWQDSTYHIGWTTEKLTVSVRDHTGETVLHRTVNALSDQSAIMEEEVVRQIPRTYKDENGRTMTFTGWVNDDKLSRVTGHLVIIPVYRSGTHRVTLDPNGGSFTNAPVDENGRHVWEVLSGERFEPVDTYHKVLRTDSSTVHYEFVGWYFLDENGQKVFDKNPILEDVTYYADWKQSERTWTITLFSDGSSANGTILGYFEGTDGDTVTYEKNHADTKAAIDAAMAGDFRLLPVPIPEDDRYTFKQWSITEYVGTRYELRPIYEMTGTGTVIFNIGEGRMYYSSESDGYDTGTYGFTVNAGEVWGIANMGGLQPAAVLWSDEYSVWDETVGAWDWLKACYADEHYLYTFKEWQTSDGQTAWTFEPGQVVTVTAVYDRHPRRLTTRFLIDRKAEDIEAFPNDSASPEYVIYATLGDTLDPSEIPVPVKTIANDPYDDSLWQYVFDHWECVETGVPSVELTVNGNRTYRAVFRKEYRQVTMTFDAGEHAVFPSSGERYYSVTVNRGTNFGQLSSTVEIPVRTDGTTYVFVGWGSYADVYDIMHDSDTLPSRATWWNTERNCGEGEEHMIQIILDTGDANAVFQNTGSRYYTVFIEPGKVLVDSAEWTEENGDNEWPIGYLSNFLIVKDGVEYVGIYRPDLPFACTMENDGTVIRADALMTWEEWDASSREE